MLKVTRFICFYAVSFLSFPEGIWALPKTILTESNFLNIYHWMDKLSNNVIAHCTCGDIIY
jgi:hypothetical protein